MVVAADFNAAFDELVADPVLGIGGWQKGRRLFFVDASLMVAVLRTEMRWIPPAELLLVVRHRALRDMDDGVPREPPTNPHEYPIKARPSQAAALLRDDWAFAPETVGLGRRYGLTDDVPYPHMSVEDCRRVLPPIGEVLVDVLPQLSAHLTAERLLSLLEQGGGESWIEQRWIADLRREVAR